MAAILNYNFVMLDHPMRRNKAWETGIAPTEWKKSVLVLLRKKGSAMECSSYRTIALTSHLGKVLMMIITEKLRSHIEEHMAEKQAGVV